MKASLFQSLFSQSWYTTQKLLFSFLPATPSKSWAHSPLNKVCCSLLFLCCNSSAVRHSFAHNSRYFFCRCNIIKLLPSSFIWRASSEILLRNLKELKSSQMWHNLLKLRGLSILGILCISTVSKSGKTINLNNQ